MSLSNTVVEELSRLNKAGDKSYTCPSCAGHVIFEFDRASNSRILLNFTITKSKIDGVIRLNHIYCTNENTKFLFVCLCCGKSTQHSAARLRNSKCTCQGSPPLPPPPEGGVAIEEARKGDGEEPNYDIADDTFNPDEAETEEISHQIDTITQIDTATYNNSVEVRNLFSNKNEWPGSSASFFQDEYKKTGNGKKGMVYRTLCPDSSGGVMEDLSDDEMHYHLHILRTFLDGTVSHGTDICRITHRIVSKSNDQHTKSLEVMKKGFNDAMREAFGETFKNRSDEFNSIIDRINESVNENINIHQKGVDKDQMIIHPTEHQQVRRLYTSGPLSIAKKIPMPEVKISMPEVGEVNAFAHIPANQAINHMLALGIKVQSYRAGHEADWVNDKGEYKCGFIKEMHETVKDRLKNQNLPTETKVIVIRTWSDGFEAHQIKGTNDFNNLQLYTLSLMSPKGKISKLHTLPFALCFKKENHEDIFIRLLREVYALQQVTLRYWGEDKKFIPTIAMLDMVSNDWPERCANSSLSDKGLYHKRWQHYCNFDIKKTPACRSCELQRIKKIFQGDRDTPDESRASTPTCEEPCLDWWAPGRDGVHTEDRTTYPIEPADVNMEDPTKDLHSVKLSFPLVENAINSLQIWYVSSTLVSKTKKIVLSKKYLQMIGFSPKSGVDLIRDFELGILPIESESYPMILKEYKKVDIQLKKFGTIPMHLMSLGVQKSLLKELPNIVNRRKTAQNKLWYSFTEVMQNSQRLINTLSVDWCLSMSFSGKDKHDLGTVGWRSDHYVAFTRLSLFHFGGLNEIDIPVERKIVLQAFKRVHVVWFCLVSCVLTEDPDSKVSPTRIGDLVRLFLSSCTYLWQSTRLIDEEEGEEEGEEEDEEEGEEEGPQQPTKKKRKNGSKKGPQQPTKKKKKTDVPFFANKSNYFSLLNIEEMIRYFGDMAGSWEAVFESFIQNIKRQIVVKRNNTAYLKTVLSNTLRDHVFAILNEGNPNNQDGYSRLYNFKIYKGEVYSKHPSLILEKENIVVGVIDSCGKMMICVDNRGEEGISLYEVLFDDTRGVERYCLWYSPAELKETPANRFKSRDLLLPKCTDFFLMLRAVTADGQVGPDKVSRSTVICRSWRIRNKNGKLALLTVDKKTILMSEEEKEE